MEITQAVVRGQVQAYLRIQNARDSTTRGNPTANARPSLPLKVFTIQSPVLTPRATILYPWTDLPRARSNLSFLRGIPLMP